MGVSVFGWYCNLCAGTTQNHPERPTGTTRNHPGPQRPATAPQHAPPVEVNVDYPPFDASLVGWKQANGFTLVHMMYVFFTWAYNVQANLHWQGHATLMPCVRYILLHLGVQQTPKELGPYMIGGISSQHRRLECTFDSVRSMYLLRCA